MKIFSLLIPLKNNLQFSSKNKTLQYASVFLVVLAVLFSQNVYSQARAYTNPGLEFGVANNANQQADTNFGWNATFDAGAAKMSPWYTSHPTQTGVCNIVGTGNCHPVEIWGTGFLGVPAAQGTNFVELNAYVSSMIYQNLYLVNGDNISYYFRHRARVSGVEQAGMVIEDQNQVNIATIYATTLPSSTGAWSVNQGVYTFTGTTGLYRVGFRATATGNPGAGNFLDDVKISMNPIIDMKFSNLTTNCEGNSHGSIFLRVNGRVNDPTTVAFELINPLNGSPFVTDADLTLTAVANSNGTPVISHTSGTNIYTVSIPIGNYDGGTTLGYSSPTNDEDGIQINVASVNDGAEGNETFKFEIKAQNTNGATNNFVSTSSPVFGDPYVGTTNDGFIGDLDSDGDGVANFCDLDDDNDGILDTAEICKSAISTDFFDGQSTTVTTVSGANVVPTTATITPAINRYNIGWHYGDATGAVNKEMSINFNNPVYFANDNIDFSLGGLDNGSSFGNFFVVYEDGVRLSNLDFSLANITGNITTSTINGAKAFNSGAGPNSTGSLTLNGIDRTKRIIKMGYTVHALNGSSSTSENIRPRIQIDCDMDGDGIPNQLDLDSDNDGCLDAIEGDENANLNQVVNAGGTVTVGVGSTAPNKNLCATGTCVDAQGVPTLVNSGGASDIGGDQGQGVGSSANAAVQAPACDLCNGTVYPDADGDGVADSCDLDDDNDGILDTDEGCAPVPGSVGHFFNIPANPFVASFTASLTSVSNIRAGAGAALSYPGLSGTSLSVLGIAETTSAGAIANNDYVEYDLTVGANAITISSIIMRRIGNGYRFALALINNSTTASTTLLSDVSFPLSGTGIGSSNTFAFTNQLLAAGQSYTIRIYLYSATSASRADLDDLYISNSYIFCKDTDGDGIPDSLDLDSDNDGCPDAAEGGNTMIPKTSLVASVGTLQGGNGVNPATPPTSGTFNQAVLLNLGNTVGSTSTTLGVPTIAGTGQSVGSSANAAINACFCYNDPNIASAGANTNHGITLLQRAGADNGNWPMIRKSAHTALESNTKGFVITRMTTAEITAIVSPQEGMMVYDTVAKCLKLYDGTAWSCFVTPTCP